MALSDLAVFSEQAYTTMTEVMTQQVDLFNAASRNTIQLSAGANQGDYNEKAFFAKVSGLVRRRNAYGTGAVTAKTLQHLTDTMVKVGAGTAPVRIDPGQFKWIQQNPELAGTVIGQQMAKDAMGDQLNTAIGAAVAALSGVSAVIYDATGDTPDTLTAAALNKGAAKFGDASSEIAAWIVHSAPMHDFYSNAIANASQLFTYGSINVIADPFGRVFVVTDSTPLITTGTPNIYNCLGLTQGAITVEQNNDFTDNTETKNGDENIIRTYQAEWSFNLGVKGFSWDKTNGGKSPTDAALMTQTNWDKIVTSNKDLAGVLVKVN